MVAQHYICRAERLVFTTQLSLNRICLFVCLFVCSQKWNSIYWEIPCNFYCADIFVNFFNKFPLFSFVRTFFFICADIFDYPQFFFYPQFFSPPYIFFNTQLFFHTNYFFTPIFFYNPQFLFTPNFFSHPILTLWWIESKREPNGP